MAARRVATSSIEWAKFAERVAPNQKEAFRAFKARSEMFVSRVHKYPENMPAIDWSFYKTRLANPAIVDEFKKQFDAVSISYPKDNKNVKGSIDASEKEELKISADYIAQMNLLINDTKMLVDKIDSIPPLEEMTEEMYSMYFPDQARNPEKRPTLWPHTKIHQPLACGGTDKEEIPAGQISLGKYAE